MDVLETSGLLSSHSTLGESNKKFNKALLDPTGIQIITVKSFHSITKQCLQKLRLNLCCKTI